MATGRTNLRLGKRDDGRLVSSEEFAEAEFDEPWKYERFEGKLTVMAPSGERHSDAAESWRDWLGASKLARPGIVHRVACEAGVRIHPGTDRLADIAVYLIKPGPIPPRPDRVPDLTFEVVSRGKRSRDRDYVAKKAEYHRLGVREYVIADRFRSIVTILTWTPDGYAERTLNADDIHTSPLLPGLAIPLAQVFP